MEIKKRSEIDTKFKWKIDDLFESDLSWEESFENTKKKLPEITKYKGKIDKDNLLECLKLNFKLSFEVEKLYVYANLRHYEDSTNEKYQNYSGMADSIVTLYSSLSSFIEPEILSLENIEDMGDYKQYIENIIRNKDHILSPEKEEILAQFYEIEQAPENIYSILNNADMTFDSVLNKDGKELPLTHGKYISYLESSDRVLRKNAYESFYNTYLKFKNTMATIYNSSVKKDELDASLRKYNSSLEANLFATNIDTEVYENLIETVGNNLHLMHRYISLRKKILSVDELRFYDIYTPIVKNVDIKVPFEKGKETVLKALEVMGEEYTAILQNAFKEGWIDVYENAGKRSGAYAWGCYGTHPYVSLNYDDTLNSMFTLIHEMGHAMHSYYTWENQPYHYGDYTIFVAEVASTVNEALLMEYLLNNEKDEKTRLYLINYFMEQFRGTFFRQTMFAEFELIAHKLSKEGQTLTFDSLCEIYGNLNKKYYGEDIVLDEKINMEWARIPHFYTAFYVYQYATGYSAAIDLSRKILNNNNAENYINNFLKKGSSDYSINLLKNAGVDMTKKEPVENSLKVFEELLDEFEKLIEK